MAKGQCVKETAKIQRGFCMLNCHTVKTNLYFCQDLFNKEQNPVKKQFLLNMALLEICGWIEEALDNIYLNRPNDMIKKHIKGIYSFEYAKIQTVLAFCIGVHRLQELEKHTEVSYTAEYVEFKNTINILHKYRNLSAHKNAEATSNTIGFSNLFQYFYIIRKSLIYIERLVATEHKNIAAHR